MKQKLMSLAKPAVTPLTRVVLKNHYKGSREVAEVGTYEKVVVIAPHMDDETIGVGGTIRKHVEQGAEVHCVFTTDGAGSESGHSREVLSQMRKDEMAEVNTILNMKDIHYLDLPDGNVQSDEYSQKALQEVLEKIDPDLIYCTPLVDAHPDHTATTALLSDVLKKNPDMDPMIRLYEINCPIPPGEINCIIDISSTFEQKKEAIAKFGSQVIAFDGFLEMNRLKTNLVSDKSCRAVEGFMQLSSGEFVKQFERLRENADRYPQLFKQVNRTVTLLWAVFKNYRQKKQIYQERLFE